VIWSNLEYVGLRLIRRFVFRGPGLDRLAWALPYFKANQATLDPGPIVDAYQDLLAQAGVDPAGKRVVELGCGATNATGYEWTARLGGQWIGVEPFALFDEALDHELLNRVRLRRPGAGDFETRRVKDLADVPDGWAELIVSNSVLEHVADPDQLFRQCRRVLAPGGVILHQVDYRDHFFKYPFHFLQFSRQTWDNWLNPGDLPRWRLDDHLTGLARAGFAAQVLKRQTDRAGFDRITPFLDREFAGREPDTLAVTLAAISAKVIS
jgi:SAM-dependent methyltransferase